MITRKKYLLFIPFVGLILVTWSLMQQTPVAAGQSDLLSDPRLYESVYLSSAIDQTAAAKGDADEGVILPPPQFQGAVGGQRFTDFNGDGFDDLAVGVPYEDIEDGKTTISNAGAINVIPGGSNGLTAVGDQIITRPTTGVTYPAAWGEALGDRLTVGDFNGDGYMDLVTGMRYAYHAAGSVQVFYGSATGLQNPDSQHVFSQAGNIEGILEEGDRFGSAIAAGDFDGDGYDDLAVGSPGENVGSIYYAGAVNIIFGSANGLTEAGNKIWIEDDFDLFGVSQANDQFGRALAAADFDQDGYTDLAIGIPGQNLGVEGSTIIWAGVTFIMYGSSTGPTTDGFQLWSQSGDIEGILESGDQFGYVLHTGDFNGDGYGDLAVGLPWEDVGSIAQAGAVNIIYGSASGLDTAGNQIIDPNNSGFGAALSANEEYFFGNALTAGDYNDDGYDDLVIGIPYQDLGPISDVGAAVIIPGGQNGLNTADYQFLAQNNNLILGTAEFHDYFGGALTTGDYNGDGYADLGVGVPGDRVDDTSAGSVMVFYGYEGGVLIESNEMWNQGSPGVTGAPESFDGFGISLP